MKDEEGEDVVVEGGAVICCGGKSLFFVPTSSPVTARVIQNPICCGAFIFPVSGSRFVGAVNSEKSYRSDRS